MINNYYQMPFTFRHGAHLLTAVRLRLARYLTEDDPIPPPPEPDPIPPPPEPEPIPVPEPDPVPPPPDDPVPPPPPDDWELDEHVYPGFLVLVPESEIKDVISHKGRGYQIVTEYTLTAWAISNAVFDRHMDKTLAHHGSWRKPHYVFVVGVEHPQYAQLLAYVIGRGGVVVAP